MTEEKKPGSAESGAAELPEFASFLRDMGIRALDQFATRLTKKQEGEAKEPKPARKIADHWLHMSEEEKERFVGQVIRTAETIAAAAPAALAALKGTASASKAKKSGGKKAGAKKSAAKKSTKSATGGDDGKKKKPKKKK